MTVEYVPYNLTPERVAELWDGHAAGQTVSQLARRFEKKQGSMYSRIQASGGIRPTIPKRAARHLTLEEREEISHGLAAGHSIRAIATRLGRVVVGPARHPDELGEPRDRELCVLADPLEVLEGGRYSAPFFHTRSCTWASPSAAFSSSFR